MKKKRRLTAFDIILVCAMAGVIFGIVLTKRAFDAWYYEPILKVTAPVYDDSYDHIYQGRGDLAIHLKALCGCDPIVPLQQETGPKVK